MEVIPTTIPDVLLIYPEVHSDERGFFIEVFHAGRFAVAGMQVTFVQDNHSGSTRGVLRGLHYQIRHSQGKLIRVVAGEIFDVAVDLRRSSPTYGKWVAHELSVENKIQMWIPPGFAHGFLVLSDWAELVYKVTDYYAPEWERTLLWNDVDVGIKWPLEDSQQPFLSTKDTKGRPLKSIELYA